MWDSLLNALRLDTVKEMLPLWNGDRPSLKLVSQGINAVYEFQSQSRVLYLRITHERLRKLSELEAALSFQGHLSCSSVPVCKLVKSVRSVFSETE